MQSIPETTTHSRSHRTTDKKTHRHMHTFQQLPHIPEATTQSTHATTQPHNRRMHTFQKISHAPKPLPYTAYWFCDWPPTHVFPRTVGVFVRNHLGMLAQAEQVVPHFVDIHRLLQSVPVQAYQDTCRDKNAAVFPRDAVNRYCLQTA